MNTTEVVVIVTSTTTALFVAVYYVCQYYIRVPRMSTIPDASDIESISSARIIDFDDDIESN